MYIIKRLCTKVFSYTLTVYSNLNSGLNQSMVEYKGNKKLSCRREAVRCFVFVCSQLQHTYSAVKKFTARRVCIACICSGKMSVCLSVRLSHVGIVPNWLYISSKFFHRQTGYQYSDGNPSNGGAECKGVWKNHNIGLYLGTDATKKVVLIRQRTSTIITMYGLKYVFLY